MSTNMPPITTDARRRCRRWRTILTVAVIAAFADTAVDVAFIDISGDDGPRAASVYQWADYGLAAASAPYAR